MDTKSNLRVTKYLNRALTASLVAALFILTAAPGFAHGGFDHVMGNVVEVANNVLTLKTTKGNLDVRLDDKTELTKNSGKATVLDLKPGARVVVDVVDGGKQRLAHSVKIGAAGKTADQHSHNSHK